MTCRFSLGIKLNFKSKMDELLMKVDISCIFAGVRPHAEPGVRAVFGEGCGGEGARPQAKLG